MEVDMSFKNTSAITKKSLIYSCFPLLFYPLLLPFYPLSPEYSFKFNPEL